MNENYLKLFGYSVRKLRQNAGFSQEELAYKSGLHRTYIGSVERGERNLSLKTIYKLAEALDIKPETFFINISNLYKNTTK